MAKVVVVKCGQTLRHALHEVLAIILWHILPSLLDDAAQFVERCGAFSRHLDLEHAPGILDGIEVGALRWPLEGLNPVLDKPLLDDYRGVDARVILHEHEIVAAERSAGPDQTLFQYL